MKILAHSVKTDAHTKEVIDVFFNELIANDIEIVVTEKLYSNCDIFCLEKWGHFKVLTTEQIAKENIDFILSFGGDGTVLTIVDIIKHNNVPVIGVNTGNLGFLTKVSKRDSKEVIRRIKENNYDISERNLLQVDIGGEETMFALNEVTITRKIAEMIDISTFVDGKYLVTYGADGLIIATATGSTAYSLSCGGPIIVPEIKDFILTPIAPHNLNLRPIIIHRNSNISCIINYRHSEEKHFRVSADTKIKLISTSKKVEIKKAPFGYKMFVYSEDFFETIRQKLLWGEKYKK